MPERRINESGESSTAVMSQRLAKILSDAQALPDEEIKTLMAKFPDEYLGDVLVREKILLKVYLQGLLVRALHIPWIGVDGCIVPPNLVDMFTEKFCRDKRLIPLNCLRDTLTIACVNPLDKEAIDEVQYATAYNIRIVMCSDEHLDELLKNTYEKPEEEGKVVEIDSKTGGNGEGETEGQDEKKPAPPDAIVIEEEKEKIPPPDPEPDDSQEERKRLASKLSAQLSEPPTQVEEKQAENGDKASNES